MLHKPIAKLLHPAAPIYLLVALAGCVGRQDTLTEDPVTMVMTIQEVGNYVILDGRATYYQFVQEAGLALCSGFATSNGVTKLRKTAFDYLRGSEVPLETGDSRPGWRVSPDGTRVHVAAEDDPRDARDTRLVLDRRTGRTLAKLRTHEPRFGRFVWSRNNERVLNFAGAFFNGELPVYLYDLKGADPRQTLSPRVFNGHVKHYLSAVAISPDAATVASADWGGNLLLWDAESLEVIRKFPQFRDEDYIPNRPDLYYKDCSGAAPVLAMEFLPDGRRLAVVLTTGMVCLLDTSAGTVLWRYQQPGGTTLGDLTPVRFRPDEAVPLAVAPDGAQLMYTMHTQPVRLLDTETGRLLGEFQGHTRTSLWDLNDAGQPGGVRALAFTPDGLGAVTGGDDGTIRVWRLP